MNNQQIRAQAEQLFRPVPGQPEKDTAFTVVAAETKATNVKTAQLKALRMERDGAIRPEPRQSVRFQSFKPIVRR